MLTVSIRYKIHTCRYLQITADEILVLKGVLQCKSGGTQEELQGPEILADRVPLGFFRTLAVSIEWSHHSDTLSWALWSVTGHTSMIMPY